MRRSIEVDNILREAGDMARQAHQDVTTGHILLGMLTIPNRGARMLGELRVDADRLLDALALVKKTNRSLLDAADVFERIDDRMADAASATGTDLASSLHLLLALSREKGSVAYQAFGLLGVAPARVRTLALSQLVGPPPREQKARRDRSAAFRDEPTHTVSLADGPEPLPQRQLATDAAARHGTGPEPAPAPADAPGFAFPSAPQRGQTAPPFGPGAAGTAIVDEAFELDPEQFPLLTSLGRNLTAEAAAGRIDPVIGRGALIDAMIDTINKRRSNNPCLVGEPGVGKTAVVEGLARALFEQGERVRSLRDRVIISLDVGALIAGTELRGAFSRRMAKLKDEVRRSGGRVVVFIDEIHTLVGAGSGDGALDAANDLKAALARGEFPCIGATTPQEYHRYIERDPALERRFQPLEVPEPSEADAEEILRGVVPQYEQHHGVIYLPETLTAAIRMSRRYIVDRRLPDKAINLIDTAAARAVRHGKEAVEPVDVAEVVSDATQIPVQRLLMSDAERMLGIRDFLGQHVVGHEDVLDTVSQVIQRNSAGFASHRPIGSFLFLGPTGVGKTETAKVLADFMFDSRDALTRFDMSEYMERHSVSRLLGAAPGYVGHEEAGALTASLARRPYQIILFDEIEKAHPDVLHILLQILDEGHLTDAKGRGLTFSNAVILMTSNLGADALSGGRRRIGFGGEEEGIGPAELERVLDKARKSLPPELWGRIDDKCVFGPLTKADLTAIARLLVAESSRRIAEQRDISYEIDDSVVEYLIEHGGFEPTHGARPMRRAVQRICETAVAQAILRSAVESGQRLRLTVGPDDRIEVAVVAADDSDVDLDAGDLDAGDLDAGDLTAPDLTAPDLTAADFTAADLTAADLTAAEDYTTKDLSRANDGA